MDNFDTEMAARVWQRVQDGRQEDAVSHSPTGLLHSTLTDAAVFAALSRKLHGKLIQQLAHEERSQAARLRGICVYVDGSVPKIPTPSPGSEPTGVLVRRCYVNHIRRLAEYEQHSGDTDFGPVYKELAAQEQRHCAALMELLGTGI